MIPTINNDGHSYIIPMDMYKEGYWAYNISNYFKARVDDNGTPFMIRWYKHGQLANVLNLRPFIRGRVGGYTIDDSNATADPKIIMDENASSIDWTGETTDTQAGGIAIYRTINQCYPQDGIFYGQVGLRSSDGDTVVTGIDIIFKVLDGNINMLGAKKYYVSELTKALLTFEAKMDQHDRDYQAKLTQQEQEYQAKMDQNDKEFKSKTDQVIADARAAYTKETQNTHDALTAAQAQIQANRDEQADLSNRLAGTEQQIKIHNVATLDQFATLSKQALDRLSSIGAQPQYYDTVKAMKAANPDGTNNLCETVEDGHRWLYINGVWQDCGAVKDNAFKAAYDASHDLLYGQDIRDWSKSQTGKVVEATEDFARYQDMPIMHLNIDNIDDYAYLSSDIININHDLISIQFPEMIKNVDQPNVVSMEVRQLKPADNPNDTSTFANNSLWFHFGDSQMTLNKIPDIKLNPDTDRIQFVYQIHGGTGDVYVGKPVINYGSQCIPYSPLQYVQDAQIAENSLTDGILNTSQNLMYNQTIENWTPQINGVAAISNDPLVQFANTPIMHIEEKKAGSVNSFTSKNIDVKSNVISVQLPNKVVGEDFNNSHVYFTIFPLADNEAVGDQKVNKKAISFPLGNTSMGLSKFENVTLPDGTKQIALGVNQEGVGHLFFGIPAVNYGPKCIAYSPSSIASDFDRLSKHIDNNFKIAQENSQNLLFGQDIRNWNNSILGEVSLATDGDKQFNGVPIMHIKGTETGQWNNWVSDPIEINNNIISLQLPEMIENEVLGQSSVYLSIAPIATGEKMGDDSVNKKTKNFALGNPKLALSKFENIVLPSDTKQIVISFTQRGLGDLYFGIPAVNYGSKCIAYSPSSIASDFDQLSKRIDNNFKIAQENSRNLLFGQDIRNWNNSVQGEVNITTDANKQFNGTPIIHIKGTENGQWNNWVSDPIEINNNIISLQLPEMIENEDFSHSSVYLSIAPIATGEKQGDDSVNKKTKSFVLGNTELSLSKFENITLPSDTKQIVISFTQRGLGDLYFGIPTVNYGTSCISYNQLELAKEIEEGNASIPQLRINANNNEYGYDKEAAPFKLVQKSGITYGYLLFDIQGDSSRGYHKKNFKIKLFSDPDGKKKLKLQLLSSWPKTNKYNIKANWIDATQSRNIVSARLVKDALTVTGLEKAEQTKSLLQTEGLGQINGVPVELYFDDGYYGLCTLNTKKEDSTFGMDSKNVEQEVLSTEVSQADFMNSTKNIDGTDWSTEIHDTATNDIKANLKVFQDFVTNSSDVDFKAKIHDYIDVKSVMVEILYGWLSHEWDYYSKSELLATWNAGKYWYLIPYDMDSTWGLHWNGSKVDIDDDWFSFDKANSSDTAIINNQNKLHERVVKMFTPELKALGQQLRATAWSNQAIIERFKRFIDGVPAEVYKKNAGRWPDIPSLKTTSFGQIQSAVIQRGQEFDNFISKI